MKKTYEGLEMEVIRFSTEDIITTSDTKTDQDNTKVPVPVPQTDGTDGWGSETSISPSEYIYVTTDTVGGLEEYGPLDIYRPAGEGPLDNWIYYVFIDGDKIRVYLDVHDHWER